jgi:hypothetical protein
MALRLEINPNARLQWHEFGAAATPALVIDDFLANAEEVRRFALGLAYDAPGKGDYYPGWKAMVPLDGGSELVRFCAERFLARLYPGGARPPYLTTRELRSTCTFAVLAAHRDRLPADFYDQHADGRSWLATVLHLSHHCEGRGTAMWRHRATGLESWLPADMVQVRRIEESLGLRLREQLDRALARFPAFSLDDLFKALKANPQRRPFSAVEDEAWERLAYFPAGFNRLVVYPTWQLHSIVDEQDPAELTTDTMRLTLNQFVDYPVPRDLQPNGPNYPWSFYRPVAGLKE